MCGRFAIISPASELKEAFGLSEKTQELRPRYNAAPGQILPVITNTEPEKLSMYKWGLVPSWAKSEDIGSRLINARAETITQKKSFKHAAMRQRCLVPADGFFEWKKTPEGKIPFFIRMKSAKPMAFAGLWELWARGQQSLYTFTIITTEPNELLAKIHKRMPAIIQPQFRKRWLSDKELSPELIHQLLKPLDAHLLEAFTVSSLVNSVANDGPELIQKVRVEPMKQRSLF